jgi:ABC-type antimicrobial peptide transport system permease subunit
MINMTTAIDGMVFFGGILIGVISGIGGSFFVSSYFRKWDDEHASDLVQKKQHDEYI